METLTIALIIVGLILLLISSLAIFTLVKYVRSRKQYKAVRTPRQRKKANIDFSVPMSYRTVKAQTPFLKNEEAYPTYPLDNQDCFRRQISSDEGSTTAIPKPKVSIQVPPEDVLSGLLPANVYKGPPPLTKFDMEQRKISLGAVEHLSKQGRKVSAFDLRNPSITEDMFLSIKADIPSLPSSRKSSVADSDIESVGGGGAFSGSEEYSSSTTVGMKRRIADRRKVSDNVTSFLQKPKKSFKKSGKITFTTQYAPGDRSLSIHIIRAFDIARRRDVGKCNPFVRVYLLPGKKQKQQTNFVRATKEPFFNETIKFVDLELQALHRYRLKLKVMNHSAMVGKRECLGTVDVALSSINTHAKDNFNLDLFLQRSESSLASLQISLSHEATVNKLRVNIIEARNLPTKYTSTYITATLFRGDKIDRRDTGKRSARDLMFQDSLVFDVCTDITKPLTTLTLVATVNSVSIVGKNEVIGHVIFSLTSPQKGAAEHWKRVQDSPHKHHVDWHYLIDPDEL